MLSDEERKAIEYLKSRLYGNEGCKFIDVAQSDLRIFLNLAENLQKDIENWKKYCDEQENDITLKNNKICDLEFKIEKQSKEIEELNKSDESKEQSSMKYYNLYRELVDKIKAKNRRIRKIYNRLPINPKEHLHTKTECKIIIGELQSLLKKE